MRCAAETTALDAAIEDAFELPVRSVTIERSRYSTSHPIDRVDVVFADGSTTRLVCKDLARRALLPQARRVKPAFVHHPGREPAVYRELLHDAALGTARCVAVIDDGSAARWLLLECFDGVELFQVGELERWQAAARWAARLHARYAASAADLACDALPLLRHDHRWVQQWARRANWHTARADHRAIARLVALAPRLAACLGAMPATFIHGEMYASNVLVSDGDGVRVCVVDWEMAAIAPGGVDVAALTAGRWSQSARHAIEAAYCDELGVPHDAAFAAALDVCRLSSCFQWIGWNPAWQAPAQHTNDWLGDAMAIADRLGW